ncbi:MAG: site-specific integrase [Vicinamibacterales bacterium]|nr:site-specific integrase [Vicinamibacterales bacterium]
MDAELGLRIGGKTEAETIATDLRSAINAGTFKRTAEVRNDQARKAAEEAQRPAAAGVSLDQFVGIYVERGSKASGKASWKDDQYLLGTLCDHRTGDGRRLGAWPLTSITEDELEVFHAARRAAGRAASTLNHLVQVITASFRWAARKGYLVRSPISDGSALKRAKHSQRTRRLMPDEEAKLLATAGALTRGAGVRLSGLIIAALETGCRRGELLTLRWADVDIERRELRVRAENAKDGDVRVVPISSRFAAVLEMAKIDPAGRRYPPAAHVFGILGEPVKSVKRAWETCLLSAYGHEPLRLRSGGLSAESRAALAEIDLHFHDLRHEAGSRWLEAGMPLHHIKEILGHANISQTDTYLNAGRLALHDSIKRFDAARGKSVAKTPPIEHRPVGHEETETTRKDPLH